MWGKKVRIYYHGIPFFCVSCYQIGHNRSECPNKLISWKDYINYLVGTGINSNFFGTWLDSNVSTTRESQSDVPQPYFENNKPTNETDADEDIDFSTLPQNVVNLLRKLSSSTPISNKKPQSNGSESKSKSKNRQQEYFRGRGRGRGNQNSGRGRGDFSFRGNRGNRGGNGRGRGFNP